MALFSDVDWVIVLVVAAVLLFGPENRAMLRTLGRYYGRAMRLRDELLGEVVRSADLPVGPGASLSLRNALLGEGTIPDRPAVPVAVTTAPTLTYPPAGSAWTGAMGPQSWSLALPPMAGEGGTRP